MGRASSSSVGGVTSPRLSLPPGSPDLIARDEDFWAEVRGAFIVDRSPVNLDNGGVRHRAAC